MKIRPVGVELFHANGQTDGQDEATVAFRNFAKAPKNYTHCSRMDCRTVLAPRGTITSAA